MSNSVLRKAVLPLGIVVVAVVIFAAMVKLKPQPERHRPPVPRPVISVFTVTDQVDPIRIRGFGTVQAKRSISLVSQVSGEVVAKSEELEPGGFFQAGQVLLQIDDTDYVLALERAQADVAQAEYNLALAEEEALVARQEWDRMEAKGADTDGPSALVLHEPQLKLARANLEAAGAARTQAEVNLSRCTISAPFTGRALTAEVDAGQYLRAGTTIGSIYATDVAEVTVSVADGDLAWIVVANGDVGKHRLDPVQISAEFAGARHTWAGEAVRIGGAIDARSRLVPVVVEIADPYARMGQRPPLVEGMFVEATFSGTAPSGSVAIPRSALRPDDKVWVVDDEGLIRITDVDVARAGVNDAVITSGLAPGVRICTSNLQFVTEGMAVRVEGEPAPEPQVAADHGAGEDTP